MTPNDPDSTSAASASRARLIVCVGFFVATDLALISRVWMFENDTLLIVIGLLMSQCSLTAIWSSLSDTNVYLRFAAAPIGGIVSWYVLTQLLPWGIGDPASAAWAIAIAIQSFVIVVGIGFYKIAADRHPVSGDDLTNARRSPLTFQLRTLVLWTTLFAAGFGFVQYGRTHWQWTTGLAGWDYFRVMPVIGLANAFVTLIWLWAMAEHRWRRRAIKMSIALATAVAITLALAPVIELVSGMRTMEMDHEVMVMVASESFFVVAVLAVMLLGKQATWRASPYPAAVTPE